MLNYLNTEFYIYIYNSLLYNCIYTYNVTHLFKFLQMSHEKTKE